MNEWTVYILKCSDGKYYVGCTGNFDSRISRHNQGTVEFTKTRRPLVVVLRLLFPDKYKAYQFEKYLKSGSGREFMRRHFI